MKEITTGKKKRNWRVVKTPTRTKSILDTLLGGLQLDLDPELIKLTCVSETDGFIAYSRLWRKDWEVTLDTAVTCDNIVVTAIASIPECAAS